MKNREKYADEIIDATMYGTCRETRKIAGIACGRDMCEECIKEYGAWLEAEYVEPPVDWSKVEIDTPILVSVDGEYWEKRHFASYIDGFVNVWDDGKTSFTCECGTSWPYAKLAEEGADNE